MIDVMNLALKYGGFTSLDKAYLKNSLAGLSREEALILVSPPPSVVNAYFAELYQKESPQAATAYYLELSQAFGWFKTEPSFAQESQPFVRLNLSGRSYGFVYESDQEIAQVFSEKDQAVTAQVLMEIAQIFPHYKVYQEAGKIKMGPLEFAEDEQEVVELDQNALLTDAVRLQGDILKLSGYNAQEVLNLAEQLKKEAQNPIYYGFSQRQFSIYIKG